MSNFEVKGEQKEGRKKEQLCNPLVCQNEKFHKTHTVLTQFISHENTILNQTQIASTLACRLFIKVNISK